MRRGTASLECVESGKSDCEKKRKLRRRLRTETRNQLNKYDLIKNYLICNKRCLVFAHEMEIYFTRKDSQIK